MSTQTSANENSGHKEKSGNENTELIHREKVERTPFYIVGNEEQGYFLTMGKYRLTEAARTIEEVKEQLETNMWDIILKLVLTSHELVISNLQELAAREEKAK